MQIKTYLLRYRVSPCKKKICSTQGIFVRLKTSVLKCAAFPCSFALVGSKSTTTISSVEDVMEHRGNTVRSLIYLLYYMLVYTAVLTFVNMF